MFGDLDWPLNASRGLSAIAEFVVKLGRQIHIVSLLSRRTAVTASADEVPVFQQDNAPALRARQTVQLLRRETAEFIASDVWPPNCPDPNSVDYCIWGLV